MKISENGISVNNRAERSDTPDVPSVEVRPLTSDDASTYIELLRQNDERMRSPKHKMALLALLQDENGLIKRIEAGEERRGIWADGQLVGGIDTMPASRSDSQEVAYWLDQNSTRKGIGLRALREVAAKKDEEGVRLIAHVEPENFSSMRLLDQSGFHESPSSDQPGMYSYYRSVRKRLS